MSPSLPALFDAHFHVFEPRFPVVANNGYVPEEFTIEDYRASTAGLGVVGGAVVSSSFQGYDQSYLVDALDRLGPEYVGVTQLPPEVTDDEVLRLNEIGVRAIRYNLYRGDSELLRHLDALARRVHEIAGWHTELYVDTAAIADLVPVLAALPQISVDHLGLSGAGLPDLLRLVEGGARVKASGFSRCDLDVPETLRAIVAANPAALMVATDLPSTRAPRPFEDGDLLVVLDTLGPDLAQGAFKENAIELYRPAARR